MKRTYLLNRVCTAGVVSMATVFASGCGSGHEQPNSTTAASAGGAASAPTDSTALGPEISVTGCLTANLDGGSYALTPTDTPPTSAERSMQMPGRETVTYELVGNAEDFRRHANTVVTARGREDASARREADAERKDEAEQRPAPGTSDTPTVETKEEVEVNVRRLAVSSVVAAGATCPSMGGGDNPSTSPQTKR